MSEEIKIEIKRLGAEQVSLTISGGGISFYDCWGLGVYDYWMRVIAPSYHERVIIPKLYEKAITMARQVIENHKNN